jgi:hypothetical protein
MLSILFSGECPQCQLANQEIEMRQNKSDFWDCPECQLQIILEGDNAGLLTFRGKSDFKNSMKKFKLDLILEETNPDSYRNGTMIFDENHMKNFIQNNLDPVEEFTFLKLIDAYVNYKFNNFPKNEYDKQSKHFKIDFEDDTMVDKLRLRDKENNTNPMYAHWQLFDFLQIVLEKYYHNDNTNLPEIGMSKIEYYLSDKHFSNDIKRINSNPVFIKQTLKDLIIDLIRIVFLNEIVILSGDLEELKKIKSEMNTIQQ